MKNPLPENTNHLDPAVITDLKSKANDVNTGISSLYIDLSPEQKKNYSIGEKGGYDQQIC